MAGFGFSEAQEMFRQAVEAFAKNELEPGAKERAKLEGIPKEIIKKVADMGLLGLNIPEKFGGQPADWISVGIAVEELSKVDFGAPHLITTTLVGYLALKEAREEVQQEWIPQMVRGEKLMAGIAATEPDCGSDAAAMKTRAIKDGDHYVLNGEKVPISFGMQADAMILFAKTDPSAGVRGITGFLVPLDLPGISLTRVPHMGATTVAAASIIMDNVRIPEKYRITEEGKAFYTLMGDFDFCRITLGLIPLGQAQTSLKEAIAYAKQRVAFGRPIVQYEAISFALAEEATAIEAARLLCYRALWLRDQGLSHTKETAMCKLFAPRVSLKAIHAALLVHGHIGYSEEFPLAQRLKDVLAWEIGDGTHEIMKTIIVREMMGKEALP